MNSLKLALIAVSTVAFSVGTLPNLTAGCVSGKRCGELFPGQPNFRDPCMEVYSTADKCAQDGYSQGSTPCGQSGQTTMGCDSGALETDCATA